MAKWLNTMTTNTPEEILAWIEDQIHRELQPSHLDIQDESYLHIGHSTNQGGGHFAVVIISAAFQGMSLLERHRHVHALLAQEMGRGIHALKLNTKTPDEA